MKLATHSDAQQQQQQQQQRNNNEKNFNRRKRRHHPNHDERRKNYVTENNCSMHCSRDVNAKQPYFQNKFRAMAKENTGDDGLTEEETKRSKLCAILSYVYFSFPYM